MVMPEYYHIVWSYIYQSYSRELDENAVAKPTAFRKNILLNIKDKFNLANVSEKYIILNDILPVIESEFNRIISKHSVFYWLHIYRRIAPNLVSELGNNTDEETVIVVRNHLEQAIYKYGSLSKFDDYALSSDIEFKDILGGLLVECLENNLSKEQVNLYANEIKKNKQWVLTSFEKESLFNIYYLEGVAYQYWYILAKMRAIGKNIDATIDIHGVINEHRSEEQDSLILSFDTRNSENSASFGMTSNVGTFVKSELGDVNSTIFCALVNSKRYTLSDQGVNAGAYDFSPNFLPFFINADSFYNSHKYLEEKFSKRFGFGLLELCEMLKLLSKVAISSSDNHTLKVMGGKNNDWLRIYSHFQRGYKVYALTYDELKFELNKCLDQLTNTGMSTGSNLESQFEDIIKFLTIDDSNQKNIGIWSNGPKPVLMKSNNMYILEYTSIYYLLKNLFFGLRHYDPKNKKGFEFEDSLCELARKNRFDVILDSTEIKTQSQQREVDVGVRVGDKLFLFECKCFERPLNFDIGEPKTINHRIEELDKKLVQADTLREFVMENRKGTNYDFSWATEIYSYVVSPYTEWVWSKDERLWSSNPDIPRIVSVHEVIELLKSEKNLSEKIIKSDS
jgi:hypothetical protein